MHEWKALDCSQPIVEVTDGAITTGPTTRTWGADEAGLWLDGELIGFPEASREVLRLAEEAAALRRALLPARVFEIALLRRERELLIVLEKERAGVLDSVLNHGQVRASQLDRLADIMVAIQALHQEARGGVLLPEGVPCRCLLCAPEGGGQGEAGAPVASPREIAWSHQDDPEHFGQVLPCGDPECRQPNCPTAQPTAAPGNQSGRWVAVYGGGALCPDAVPHRRRPATSILDAATPNPICARCSVVLRWEREESN